MANWQLAEFELYDEQLNTYPIFRSLRQPDFMEIFSIGKAFDALSDRFEKDSTFGDKLIGPLAISDSAAFSIVSAGVIDAQVSEDRVFSQTVQGEVVQVDVRRDWFIATWMTWLNWRASGKLITRLANLLSDDVARAELLRIHRNGHVAIKTQQFGIHRTFEMIRKSLRGDEVFMKPLNFSYNRLLAELRKRKGTQK